MNYFKRSIFIFIGPLFFIFMLSSCSYESTIIDISSLWESTWNFNKSASYQFDASYVEIVNGSAQLKTLDLDISGTDFNNGTHNGTVFDGQELSIFNDKNSNLLKVTEILPAQSNNLLTYLRFDNNFSQEVSFPDAVDEGGNTFSAESQLGSHALVSSPDTFKIINLENFDVESNSFTTSVWINPSSYTSWQRIVTEESIYPDVDWQLLQNANDGDFYFTIKMTNDMHCSNHTSGSFAVVPLDEWTHLVARYDSILSEISLYQDGKMLGVPTTCAFPIQNAVNTLGFGSSSYSGGDAYDGLIDEVAIWKTALTSEEILKLYDKQKLDRTGTYDTEVIDVGATTHNWPNLSWLTDLPFGKELIGDFDSDGTPDSESSTDYTLIQNTLHTGLVAYWGFNESAAGTAPLSSDIADLSGGGHHLTVPTAVNYNIESIFSTALQFSDSGNHATVSYASSLNTNQFSVSSWVQITGGEGNFRYPIFNRTAVNLGGNLYDTYGYNFYASSSNIWQFWIGKGENTLSPWGVVSGPAVQIGEWVHLLGMYDGEKMIFYVNGEKAGELVSTFLPNPASLASNFRLGGCFGCSTGPYMNLDETAFWNRTLTETEVLELYRRGANRVKLQVKNCVDAACECKTFNSTPLGTALDCDGDGIINSLDLDDDHKSEFVGPGGDNTTFYSELFNRKATDITFSCALNTSDSNAGVCVADEISRTNGPKPTGPLFLNTDYTQFVNPTLNQYGQVRVYMDAEENTACAGTTCLPTLSSFSLNPSGITKYAGGLQEVKPLTTITYKKITGATIKADTCVTYRLSPDGLTDYYYSGGSWLPIVTDADRSTAIELEQNIQIFASQFGPGELFLTAYLSTTSDLSQGCSIDDISIDYE